MQKTRPALFRGRHFQDHIIVLCVRWYLRYCLTLRDLEEMMAERGLGIDHSTIGRWVLRYAPDCINAFATIRETPTDPGGLTKPTFASLGGRPTCIRPWIQPARPST